MPLAANPEDNPVNQDLLDYGAFNLGPFHDGEIIDDGHAVTVVFLEEDIGDPEIELRERHGGRRPGLGQRHTFRGLNIAGHSGRCPLDVGLLCGSDRRTQLPFRRKNFGLHLGVACRSLG